MPIFRIIALAGSLDWMVFSLVWKVNRFLASRQSPLTALEKTFSKFLRGKKRKALEALIWRLACVHFLGVKPKNCQVCPKRKFQVWSKTGFEAFQFQALIRSLSILHSYWLLYFLEALCNIIWNLPPSFFKALWIFENGSKFQIKWHDVFKIMLLK